MITNQELIQLWAAAHEAQRRALIATTRQFGSSVRNVKLAQARALIDDINRAEATDPELKSRPWEIKRREQEQ